MTTTQITGLTANSAENYQKQEVKLTGTERMRAGTNDWIMKQEITNMNIHSKHLSICRLRARDAYFLGTSCDCHINMFPLD